MLPFRMSASAESDPNRRFVARSLLSPWVGRIEGQRKDQCLPVLVSLAREIDRTAGHHAKCVNSTIKRANSIEVSLSQFTPACFTERNSARLPACKGHSRDVLSRIVRSGIRAHHRSFRLVSRRAQLRCNRCQPLAEPTMTRIGAMARMPI